MIKITDQIFLKFLAFLLTNQLIYDLTQRRESTLAANRISYQYLPWTRNLASL